MMTLLIAILSIVALMIIHEYGHFIIAKKFGVKVEEFGIGYPPRIFGKKFGETLYSINLFPLGAFVKIHGEEGGVDDYRSFSNLSIWKRVLIVLGGVIAFWVAAIVIFSIVFMVGASVPIGDKDITGFTDTHIEVLSVQKGSPAEIAGVMPGDELLNTSKISDFQKFVENNRGREITLNIKRDGKNIDLKLTPRVSYGDNEGPTGVTIERMANIIKQYPWYVAPIHGLVYTGEVTWGGLVGIYGFFASLFKGDGLPDGAELAGPIGITIFLSRAVNYGLGFFLYFIGSLTVLLAIFNLFPIPALDGGKLIFLVIEKIIGKPVSLRWEQGITIFFFVVLITLSLFVTIKFDIPRVIEFWKAGL